MRLFIPSKPTDADPKVLVITIDSFPDIARGQLLYVPLRPGVASVEEGRFVGCCPYCIVGREIVFFLN